MVVVAIAVGAMINVNLNKVSNNGDLALANVEALAQGEITFYLCAGSSGYCSYEVGYGVLWGHRIG